MQKYTAAFSMQPGLQADFNEKKKYRVQCIVSFTTEISFGF